MIINVGNRIEVLDASKEIFSWAMSEFVLDNPEYYKRQNMGRWVGNIPKKIWLFEIKGKNLILPFGCLRDLWSKYPSKGRYKLNIKPVERRKYVSDINTYPYQEKAVKTALSAKNGVLVMPTGSGKTQCGLEIISRVGGRALWLTHTADLLKQSKSRAEKVLTTDGTFGTITGGKVNIGTHITFATVQTMANLDLAQYKDCFDVVIVDECHRCAGSPTKVTQFYKVLSNLSARYKIGLTATPYRSDGLEKSMFALLGSIVCEISKEEVADTTCPIKVQKIYTGYMPDFKCVLMGDGTINYANLIDDMTKDEQRTGKIVSEISEAMKNGPTMVLANRVEFLHRLCDKVGGNSLCLSGSGISKKDRQNALIRLNNGELDCIFATYQLAAEGLDVPNLRYLVFATPEKNERTVTQSIGRVGRKADGKEYGIVIDFVDEFGMFKGWANARNRIYKKLGVENDTIKSYRETGREKIN